MQFERKQLSLVQSPMTLKWQQYLRVTKIHLTLRIPWWDNLQDHWLFVPTLIYHILFSQCSCYCVEDLAYFFKCLFVFERESVCVCKQGRGREREGNEESKAGSTLPVQSPVWGLNSQIMRSAWADHSLTDWPTQAPWKPCLVSGIEYTYLGLAPPSQLP